MSSLIVRYVLAILVVTMLLGFSLYTQVTRRILDGHTERMALAVAESVAANQTVRAEMATGDPQFAVQGTAEQIRKATGAAYVVVIDRRGIRHSHPNVDLIGQPVEEPLVVLDGHTHVGIDPGSLGDSANGKAPVRALDGRIVGEVSVGFLERDVSRQLWSEIPSLLLHTAAALLVGVVASLILARRLKRRTFGLELDDIASLLQEREAMLHGIRAGVVAFDRQGRLTMVNDEARRLLDLRRAALDEPLDRLLPEGRLRDVLSGAVTGPDQLVLTDERLLVVNRMPVGVNGRDVGSVVTLRDRTELEALLRELDSVHGLTDALRAQQHEFSNRLHVLSVLVGMGDHDEAMAYLDEISATSSGQAEDLRSRIAPPALAALLLAKITIAAERGIGLTVTEDSRLDHPGQDPRALQTIVGNLIDNAMDAVGGSARPRRISVHLRYDDERGVMTVTVTDSGPGVPPEMAERIFQDGYTTKEPRSGLQRGLGLALVHRLVNQAGGSISVTPGRPGAEAARAAADVGATFTVVLPVGAVALAPDGTPTRTDAL
ncbi:MAG: ATP-binding protein [Actinomycetes bacterium]